MLYPIGGKEPFLDCIIGGPGLFSDSVEPLALGFSDYIILGTFGGWLPILLGLWDG